MFMLVHLTMIWYSKRRLTPKTRREDRLPTKPYLLFDAGGTLVFPDQDILIQEARQRGIELSNEQLYEGYYRLIHHLDLQRRQDPHLFHAPWPQGYAFALFETLGVNGAAARATAEAVQERHEHKNLWTFTFEWVYKTLYRLAGQGYRMSVISNSDGRTEQVFCDAGLRHFFEHIFDSKELGFEKPDATVFRLALDQLDPQPADALYIGDFYGVDVQGANNAGLGALHLDPFALYADWPGVHLVDVRSLPGWLVEYAATPQAFDLYPEKPVQVPKFTTGQELVEQLAPGSNGRSKPGLAKSCGLDAVFRAHGGRPQVSKEETTPVGEKDYAVRTS